MMRSADRNRPGPIVFALAGTEVVRLLKLVMCVLFDGEGMQLRAEAVRLALPLCVVGEFGGEVRFPERDVKNPANTENYLQSGARRFQFVDAIGVGGSSSRVAKWRWLAGTVSESKGP